MKLLVSDFDGTYYVDEENIYINNKKIQEFRKNGNIFMLSSGRSFNSLKKMCKKYNIEYDYLSCGDGSVLYDNDDNILIKYNLKEDILQKFINLKSFVDVEFMQYSYPDDYYHEYLDNNLIGLNLVIRNELINNKFLTEFKKLKKLYKEFDFLIYSHDEISYFCLKNKGINKSSTVNFLKEKFNLLNDKIYTIGDNENDYYMLKLFNGYYIGNVNQRIKNVCLGGYNQVFELLLDIEKSD